MMAEIEEGIVEFKRSFEEVQANIGMASLLLETLSPDDRKKLIEAMHSVGVMIHETANKVDLEVNKAKAKYQL